MADEVTVESLQAQLEDERMRRRGLDAQHRDYLQGMSKLKDAGFNTVDDVLAQLNNGPVNAGASATARTGEPTFNQDDFLDEDGDYRMGDLLNAHAEHVLSNVDSLVDAKLTKRERQQQVANMTHWIADMVQEVEGLEDPQREALHRAVAGQLAGRETVSQADVKQAFDNVFDIAKSVASQTLATVDDAAAAARSTEPPAPANAPGGEAADASSTEKPWSEMSADERIEATRAAVAARQQAERAASGS